jgi:tellurite resistance protein TerC
LADFPLPVWAGFLGLVFLLLALDLGVFHRRRHAPSFKESAAWTALWVSLGLAFSAVVYWLYEGQAPGTGVPKVQEYLTGFMLEKALSVDNLFVFMILLRFFSVRAEDQHRVLFWGILGVLVTRGTMIFAGVAAVRAYAPTIYVLAALLIYTAVKMAFMGESRFRPEQSRIYQVLRRWLPLTDAPHEGRFFTREAGRRVGTSLLLCLMTIELTDVMFALDSVPAVLGVTQDPFVVYTSNVFAILGLRALYFVIAAGLASARYLQPALVIVLLFIGVKMVLDGPVNEQVGLPVVHVPIAYALGFVAGMLALAVVASALAKPEAGEESGGEDGDPDNGTGETAPPSGPT